MLTFLHLLTGFLILQLILPQTPTDNVVLRKFVESGYFINYAEAKSVLKFVTWFLIFLFLSLSIFLNFKLG